MEVCSYGGLEEGLLNFLSEQIRGWEAYSKGLQLFLLIKRRGLFECEGDSKRIEFSGWKVGVFLGGGFSKSGYFIKGRGLFGGGL